VNKTFAALKTAIGEWLDVNETELPLAVRGDIINWVVKSYCRNRESRFGEADDTFLTVAETRDYAEPDRFSKPRKFWYVHPDSGAVVVLGQLNKDKFDEKFPGSVVYRTGGPYVVAGVDTTLILGDPTHYTLWGGNILLAPVPNRVITIFRDYWEWPAELSADGDTNKMTIVDDDYVLFKSLVDSSAYGIEDQRMPMWAARALKIEAELDSEDSRRLQTGRSSQSEEPG